MSRTLEQYAVQAPIKIIKSPDKSGDENNMSRRRPDDEDVSSEVLLRRLLRRIDEQDIERRASGAERVTVRSADTLRRDIGIFAILLAMMIQTGAAFYWAGGVSRGQESAAKIIEQVQQEQAYTRAQLQLIDGKLQKMEGREAEREKQKGR